MKLLRKNIFKSMIRKEFIQLLRDPRMRGVLFGAPLMMIIVFGYAVNTDVQEIKVAILDQEKSSESRKIIESFTASRYFILQSYIHSAKEFNKLIDSGEAEVLIRFEKGFSKRIKKGKEASIQIIIDGSDSIRASVIQAYITEITGNYTLKHYKDAIKRTIIIKTLSQQGYDQIDTSLFIVKKGISLKKRFFFNPALRSRNFYLPGVIALLIGLITIMLTSMSIVKERETGTIEQIIVSPIHPFEYILGKTIPFAIIGIVDMIIVSGISIFWFNVPFNGSILFLLLTGLCYILSTLSIGLYISTVSKTQQQAMLTFFLFFFPAILLSGFVFPIYSMPEPIQVVTLINPMRYFITIIRGIFLKGTGAVALWSEIIPLLIIGAVLMIMSIRRFSRRFD